MLQISPIPWDYRIYSLILNDQDWIEGEVSKGNCYSGLKTVLKTNAAWLCEAFRSSAQLDVILNVTKAVTLPAACKVSAPSATNYRWEREGELGEVGVGAARGGDEGVASGGAILLPDPAAMMVPKQGGRRRATDREGRAVGPLAALALTLSLLLSLSTWSPTRVKSEALPSKEVNSLPLSKTSSSQAAAHRKNPSRFDPITHEG
ncbi:hypothetical protein K1719_009081 [Acacia pycnantha]|nr:hypothetical protein K1719_009081 [Acacia pycnantha]